MEKDPGALEDNALFEMIKAEVQGDYKEKLPTITFASGCTYTGEWVYGEREGYGTQTFPNGSTY